MGYDTVFSYMDSYYRVIWKHEIGHLWWSCPSHLSSRLSTWWRPPYEWRTAALHSCPGTMRKTAAWTSCLPTAACPSSSPSMGRAATTSMQPWWMWAYIPFGSMGRKQKMCILEAEPQEHWECSSCFCAPSGLLRGQLFFPITTEIDLAFHVWVCVRQRFLLTHRLSKVLRNEAHLSYTDCHVILACWPESKRQLLCPLAGKGDTMTDSII